MDKLKIALILTVIGATLQLGSTAYKFGYKEGSKDALRSYEGTYEKYEHHGMRRDATRQGRFGQVLPPSEKHH